MDHDISIETLTAITADDEAALAGLLAQLSTTASFDLARMREVVGQDATDLVVARRGPHIVGMATLVAVSLPSGRRGHVEDVVVDIAMRGRGVARLLLTALTAVADRRGLRTLDLTSRSTRESALRLYESVGFVRRDTSVLRYRPSEPSPT